MWEIEVVIELGCDPDFAGFDSAMVWWVTKCKIGLFAILEIEADIFEKNRLVIFDGKMIMRFS